MFREPRLPFAADDYRITTEATYAEITDNRYPVMQRLLGRLNRALNDDTIPLANAALLADGGEHEQAEVAAKALRRLLERLEDEYGAGIGTN